MINFLIGLLAFVLMLGVIIVIHELGHFLAARAFGVHCHEFSIGMGPAIYQRKGKNTIFSIRAIPLGGYVSIAGENGVEGDDDSQSEDALAASNADNSVEKEKIDRDLEEIAEFNVDNIELIPEKEEEEDEEEDWLSAVPENERLNNKPAWQQVIVLVAGVVMNFILALGLMTTVFAVRGYVNLPAEPVVADVYENSPAAKADLKPGDRIVRIEAQDGTIATPKTLMDVSEFLIYNHGESLFTIGRDGEEIEVYMTPDYIEESGAYQIGFVAHSPVKKINVLEAVKYGWNDLWDNTALVFRSLGNLVQGKGVESLSGPVGIYKMTDQIVSYGWMPYLSLSALISLNIGIFNLLPVPALDGGRILILLFEKITRRKMSQRVIEYIILGSYVLLFGLLIFSTYNDIVRFFF